MRRWCVSVETIPLTERSWVRRVPVKVLASCLLFRIGSDICMEGLSSLLRTPMVASESHSGLCRKMGELLVALSASCPSNSLRLCTSGVCEGAVTTDVCLSSA